MPVLRAELLRSIYRKEFTAVGKILGKLAGDSSAYEYLPASVRSFPDAEALAGRMDRAGMRHVRWTLMAGGIIALHSAVK
jgi:demethylmenaquinone methyltransferase/2-methoxy-6-polyprenyl-1,4-benzoquinol methylase